MTWTYTALPATSVTDEVHLLIGDTDPAEKLVQDEEITYFLALYPKAVGKPAYLAGAAAADAIAAKFARRAQRSVGSLSIAAQQQYEHYRDVAAFLREASITGGIGTRGAIPAYPQFGGGGATVLGSEPAYRRLL